MKKDLFTNLKANRFTVNDVESEEAPGEDRFPRNSALRMHLYVLRAAAKVIKLVPGSFIGAPKGGEEHKFIAGLNLKGEDIHRFVVLVTKFWARTQQKTEHVKGKARTPATLPVFCLPGERGNTEGQSAANRRAFEELYRQQESVEDMFEMFAFTTLNEKEEQGAAMDKVGGTKIRLRDDLPELEGDQLEMLLQVLAGKATNMFDDTRSSNSFFFPASQVWESHCEGAAEDNKLQEASSSLRPEERQWLKQERFIELQNQIHACSAVPPTWEETTRILPLQVVDLGGERDDLTKQHFKMWWRGLQVFPWQPEAAAYMLKSIRGPLEGCMNCNDTGLGKTVSTLMVVVEQSIAMQGMIDAWNGESPTARNLSLSTVCLTQRRGIREHPPPLQSSWGRGRCLSRPRDHREGRIAGESGCVGSQATSSAGAHRCATLSYRPLDQ